MTARLPAAVPRLSVADVPALPAAAHPRRPSAADGAVWLAAATPWNAAGNRSGQGITHL